jgi:hypothetical protein
LTSQSIRESRYRLSVDLAPHPAATTLGTVEVVLDRLLGVIEGDPALVHLERFPGREARHRQPVPPPALAKPVPGPLWSHQAEALDLTPPVGQLS